MFDVQGFGAVAMTAAQGSFTWRTGAATGTLLTAGGWLLAASAIGLVLSRVRDLSLRRGVARLCPQRNRLRARRLRLA